MISLILTSLVPGILLAIMLIGWGVTLAPILPRARAVLAAYRIIPRITSSDVSRLNLPPPPELETFTASLRTLDFERLGERRAHWPNGALDLDIWMMVEKEGVMYVEASIDPNGTPVASVATCFMDDAYLETGYQHPARALPLETPDYYYHVVTGSPLDLINGHQAQMKVMAKTHGPVRPIVSMDDYFEVEKLYLERYSRKRLQPELRRWGIVPLLANAFGALALTGGFFLVYLEAVEMWLALALTAVLLLPTVMVNRSVLIAPEGTW